MSRKSSVLADALSDDEMAALGELLEERSPFDHDGLLGLLHAVSVAPSTPLPSTWRRVAFPDGLGGSGANDAAARLGLVTRLHDAVLDAVSRGEAMVPPEDEVARCASFARGYAAGAELDPGWIGNDARWTFASWAAYLTGRRDLVTPHLLVTVYKDADLAAAAIRSQMRAHVASTYESFSALRRRARA